MKKTLLTAGLLLLCTSTTAHDLGVQSRVWEILEPDLRQMLVESAARANWDALKDQLTVSAKSYMDRLPKRILSVPTQTHTLWFDPSITLNEDIKAPLPDDAGNYQWGVLFKKGTTVNPLSTARPVTALLAFNGADKEQVEFVKAVLQDHPLDVVPVEATGQNPTELTKALGRSVFIADNAMIARFRVTESPSLIAPGSGDKSLYMGVTAFARPFNPAELNQVWPIRNSSTSATLKKH